MADAFPEYSDKLSGVWKLLSYDVFEMGTEDTKPAAKPHGETPLGRVVLSASGYISAILVPPQKMGLLPCDVWAHALDKDVLNIARSLVTYSGPITLAKENDTLVWTCTVEVAHNPNWIGKQQIREVSLFEEEGTSYMILRPRKINYLPGGRKGQSVLKWQKVD